MKSPSNVVGDYQYKDNGQFIRIVREVDNGDYFNEDCPILLSEEDKQNWLQWKTIDKFWEKVWQ